jgi:thiamine pyrophosphate-dependent acetolactate synthase large subunit-like protein
MHTSPSIPTTDARPASVSAALIDALQRLGVTQAFGVMGGAMAPFFRALDLSEIQHFHLRHEAGAAFAAVEASIATRRPVLVFTTAGPGLSNAITGMLAARWDGAHVIFVSAATSASNRGRVATQETTPATLGADLFTTGGALHYATTLEHPAQLGPVVARLAAGLTQPGGFVAHVALPIDIQNTPAAGPVHIVDRGDTTPMCSPQLIARHAALLAGRPLTIWLGFGARHAAEQIRCLAERTGARVMCSPRGKGIFPEDHPQFIGVTGLGGNPEVDELLTADRPEYTLVLGTRMGESTSFWTPELAPSAAFIHVDTDPAAFGAAYPEVPTIAALADVGRYCAALLAALADTPATPARVDLRPPLPSRPAPPPGRPRAPPAAPRRDPARLRRGQRRLDHGRERQFILLVHPPPALRQTRPLSRQHRLRLDGPRHQQRRRGRPRPPGQGRRPGRRRRHDDDQRAPRRRPVPRRRGVDRAQRRLLSHVRPGHARHGLAAVVLRPPAGRLRRPRPGHRRRR